jgi:dTDP-4-dehydrorhamnose 3,5-epimerase
VRRSDLNFILSEKIISGVVKFQRFTYNDERGSLIKNFSKEVSRETGFLPTEVFFTISRNSVFRGMHLQIGQHSASKLITVLRGSIQDFVIDLRENSHSFGSINKFEIDEESDFSLYIPPGIAHGYLTQRSNTQVCYLMNNEYCQICDTGVNPGVILEKLKLDIPPIISERDLKLPWKLEELNGH